MAVYEEYFDERYDFFDEGQSENRMALPTAEAIFLGYMQHSNFQLYTGVTRLRAEQIRAIFGIAELARKEAANQRRQAEGMAGSENEATERVQRLCQALRSARRRVQSLTKTLRLRDGQLASLDFPRFPRRQRNRFKQSVSSLPTAPATPAPVVGKTSGADRG